MEVDGRAYLYWLAGRRWELFTDTDSPRLLGCVKELLEPSLLIPSNMHSNTAESKQVNLLSIIVKVMINQYKSGKHFRSAVEIYVEHNKATKVVPPQFLDTWPSNYCWGYATFSTFSPSHKTPRTGWLLPTYLGKSSFKSIIRDP